MKNRFISFLVILMCFSTQLAFAESYDFITKGNKVLCSNKKCPFNIKKLNNFEIEISGFSNKDKFTLIDSRSYGDYEELQHLSVFANEKPAQKEETDNKNRYVFYCDAKTNVIKITCDREISFNSITLNNSTITFDNLSLGKTAEEL
ncbi:MAG TPA: hypothetical protein PKW72_11820, partial [Treponemataceae bacterium]|nr:hypothetical protein [Treponemataceae bacterium]